MGLRGSAAPALPLQRTEAGWAPLTQTEQLLEQTHSMGRVLDLYPENSSEKSAPTHTIQERRNKFWKPAGQDTAVCQGSGQVVLPNWH